VSAPVGVRVADGVAWVTLERPATRNRLDAAMHAALAGACEAAEDDDAVRVVVLAAAGPHFSAGLPPGRTWPEPAWGDGVAAVAALAKPVVAAVDGEARGWGAALALACDVRIATTRAAFVFPEARRGALPGGGALVRLARLVGPARALEAALVRERLPARLAAEWGVVGRVVPPARLGAAARSTARALAAKGPVALRLAKEAVVRALDLPLDDGMRLEHDLYVLLQTTEDRREGVRAFLERRAPRFSAR
jgi:enoyl-CoA hydratase/carnithine racemase